MKRIVVQLRHFRTGICDVVRHSTHQVKRIPPGAKPVLLPLLPFPVVKAWSPFGKTEGRDSIPIDAFAKSLRLINTHPSDRKSLAQVIFLMDDLYKNGDPSEYTRVYETLSNLNDKEEPEIQWRLARITYELAKKTDSPTDRANMLTQAFSLVTSALAKDELNFAVHKWVAILLNEVSVLKGLKEQITQSVEVRKHINRAVELNPNDATCRYMQGSWCYSVAEVPWYQKKIAATLFATPPESTYEEALEHFIAAENLEPDFYSMNHLMLAKTYINLGNPVKAAKYLKSLENRIIRTDDDFKAKMEAIDLIKKHFKTQKTFDEAAA